MSSILIAAKDKQKRQQYIAAFCKKQDIDLFDITTVEKDETKQSIGIEDVLLMQAKLFLKPIRSKTKATILESAQTLTIEAQNALLKVLEEPPDHTIIILSAESKEALLPTILSRCQIIELQPETVKLSEEEKEEFAAFIDHLHMLSTGEALWHAESLSKDKEKVIGWIEKLILVLRAQMLENVIPGNEKAPGSQAGMTNRCAKTIKSFQKLHTLLKTTNVNTRFAIEHTLLSVSS